MGKTFAMTFGPLPDGFKLWLEIYREVPATGFRARILKHPDAVDSIDPDSTLGRWRYIDHAADLEDYLLNIRPTHYFQMQDSLLPLLIARDLDLIERLRDIRTRLVSSKAQSFFIAGADRSQIETRLACWDSRPRWRISLDRKGATGEFELLAQPHGGAVSAFKAKIGLPTPSAIAKFIQHVDANEVERESPGTSTRSSLLIRLDGNIQAVASDMHKDLLESAHPAIQLRPTTLQGLLHRLKAFRQTAGNE